MSIADELQLLINTKEQIRLAVGASKDVPFSTYVDLIDGNPATQLTVDPALIGIERQAAILANTKESLRVAIGLSKDVPFSQYASHIPPYEKSGTVFDFVNNQYSKDQMPVNLSDISEFIRLSSTTKWQDGQLVEVQNNIPRISGEGLLIEPQATNLMARSIEPYGWLKDRSYTKEYIENIDGKMTAVRATRTSADTSRVDFNAQYPNMPIIADYIGKDTNNLPLIRNNTTGVSFYNKGYTEIKNEVVKPNIFRRIDSLSAEDGPRSVGDSMAYYINGSSSTVGNVYTMYALQILESETYSSLIITGDSPATRSPDILNIPLLPTQTITGDWDAGITYEVADNIATFTGHGYIRKITLEAL